MTNEIKEILDYLTKFINDKEEITKYGCEISVKQANKLLDYITNLQDEIFYLKDTIQNKNECIGAFECIIENRDKRIDKAVEYIEHSQSYGTMAQVMPHLKPYVNGDDLLMILRGDE